MYQQKILPHFKNQLKQLVKKYRQIKIDVISHLEKFDKRMCVSLGKGVYKLRIKSSNIKKGSNKSFRLIILIIESGKIIYPLTIYFKGDKETISKKEIKYHLQAILDDIKKEK